MADIFGKKLAFLLLISLFVTMSIGGIYTAETMMEDGAMHNCPYMGVAALCNMSPLEHLSEWQSMFTTTPQQFGPAALLLLLALALVWHFVGSLLPLQPKKVFVYRHKYRERVFDPLRLAFARGLIHPKIF